MRRMQTGTDNHLGNLDFLVSMCILALSNFCTRTLHLSPATCFPGWPALRAGFRESVTWNGDLHKYPAVPIVMPSSISRLPQNRFTPQYRPAHPPSQPKISPPPLILTTHFAICLVARAPTVRGSSLHNPRVGQNPCGFAPACHPPWADDKVLADQSPRGLNVVHPPMVRGSPVYPHVRPYKI